MTKTKFRLSMAMLVMLALCLTECNKEQNTNVSNTKEQLGKDLFFDSNLSNPIGQSCSSCHSPYTGFSDKNHSPISRGAVPQRFGFRNAPSLTYMVLGPSLHYDANDSTYVGGFFLDGRANTLQDQAKGPFLNHIEMNNDNMEMVLTKLKAASYYNLYKQVYGEISDNNKAFDNIADALAAFERTEVFAPFTSKYDYYLQGKAALTTEEQRGLQLFQDTLKGKCANCHIIDPDPVVGKVLFTDFTYDNIGIPRNTNNPYYSMSQLFNPDSRSFTDLGFGGFLQNHDNDGQFKVPSLRNAAISAPYFHNGIYNTLEEVVHFYNTRDSLFANAEIPATVNHEELGKLNLTDQEEKDIATFIRTLTDGYK